MINYFTGCRSYSRSSGRLSPSKLRDVIGVTRRDALGHVTQLRLRSRTGQVPATWNAQVSFTICRHRRLKVTAFYLRDTYLVFGIYQMLNVKGSQPVSSAYHIKLVLYRPVPSIWSSLNYCIGVPPGKVENRCSCLLTGFITYCLNLFPDLK